MFAPSDGLLIYTNASIKMSSRTVLRLNKENQVRAGRATMIRGNHIYSRAKTSLNNYYR